MTRILKTKIREQDPKEYKTRYRVHIVAGKFFYKLIYRFDDGEKSYLSVIRSTYGIIHEEYSGRVLVLEKESAMIQHAKKVVHNVEKQKNSAEPATA